MPPGRDAHPRQWVKQRPAEGPAVLPRRSRPAARQARLGVRSRRSASVRASTETRRAIRCVARDGARRGTPGRTLARHVVAVMTQSAQRSATGAARARRRARRRLRPGRRATTFRFARVGHAAKRRSGPVSFSLMVLALLLPVPVGGQLGSSQVPSDDDSTRLASFPLTAVSPRPRVTLDEVFFVSARPRRGVGAGPSCGHFRVRAQRVQGLRRRGDGGRARPSASRAPRLANSTVNAKLRVQQNGHTWVAPFNAPRTSPPRDHHGDTRGVLRQGDARLIDGVGRGGAIVRRRLVWYSWRRSTSRR